MDNVSLRGSEAGKDPIVIDFFGGPSVSCEGERRDLTAHQQAFLALVFGHAPVGVSRPRVGWLLWEEDDGPRVRQRIRQLLHRVHERVGHPVIVSDGDVLRPAGTGVTNDLDRFTTLLHRGPLAEAAGLLERRFVSRLPEIPTREYEEWLAARRVRLFEDLRAAASRRWDESTEAGLWGDARDAAEALHMHVPGDPIIVARVIESRARTGSMAAAEAAYAQFCALGTTDSALDALMDRVRKVRNAPHTPRSESEALVPLVGRRAELDSARSALEPVKSGEFRFVLLTGEGGIGKTRVLDELRQGAVLEGFRCLHARPAEPERHIPLNPFADAFEDLDLVGHLRALGAPWRTVIASLLPIDDDDPIEAIPPIQEARLSRRLLDALYLLMERVAAEEPTLLFIDDLHWADETTLTALQFIQRRWEGGPLGIVAAARADVLGESVPGRKYMFRHADLPVTHVELRELTYQDGQRLIGHVIPGDVEEHVSERLCALSGLHPLYLTELSKDLAAGRWRVPEAPTEDVAIPVSLQDILRSRVSLLSSIATKVAGLLAVRAKPMRLKEVSALTGLPIEDCADCAEELKALRLVELERDALWVSHELFRSALYQHLSDARRVVLHRAIAEHLSQEGDDIHAGELAVHYARAGERLSAARYGWSAGMGVVEHGAMAEAAFFFGLVVDNEDDAPRRAEATAELARALHLSRSIARAIPVLELAAVRLSQAGNPQRALRMDIRRVEGLSEIGTAPVGDLFVKLQAIKAEAQQLDDWEALALALDAELRFAFHTEDAAVAKKVCSELSRIKELGSPQAAIVANYALALSVLFAFPGLGVDAAEEALSLTSGNGPQRYRLRVLNRAIIVLYHQGRMREERSRGLLAEARELAGRSGDLIERVSLESNAAAELMDAGYLDEARVTFERAEKLMGKGEMAFSRINQACNRGELALGFGDYAEARSSFLKAGSFLKSTVPAYTSDFINAGVGLASLSMGDLTEARAREAVLRPVPTTYWYDPTTILRFRVRMLERRGEYDVASEILTQAAADLENRLMLAWIKIQTLRVELTVRRDSTGALSLVHHTLPIAERLGALSRARDLERLATRAQNAR